MSLRTKPRVDFLSASSRTRLPLLHPLRFIPATTLAPSNTKKALPTMVSAFSPTFRFGYSSDMFPITIHTDPCCRPHCHRLLFACLTALLRRSPALFTQITFTYPAIILTTNTHTDLPSTTSTKAVALLTTVCCWHYFVVLLYLSMTLFIKRKRAHTYHFRH